MKVNTWIIEGRERESREGKKEGGRDRDERVREVFQEGGCLQMPKK